MMHRQIALLCRWAIGLSLAATSLTQGEDIVYKLDGGRVSGTVLSDESTATFVVVQTRFGKQRIERSNVKEIQIGSKAVEDYKEAAKSFDDTADGHYQLALWCAKHHLRKEYLMHLQKAIALDPHHAAARKRLGYRLHQGKWMTRDEVMQSQGYVRHEGRWVLPQEREMAKAKTEERRTIQEYYKKFKVWQHWLRDERQERRAAAREALAEVADPLAVKPLMDILAEKGNDDERLLAVEVLAQIPGEAGSRGLLEIAMRDPLGPNRAHAVAVLADRMTPVLLEQIVRSLQDNDNEKVRRAAEILGEVGDESLYPALVEALVTTHKFVYEPTILDAARRAGAQLVSPLQATAVLPSGTRIIPTSPVLPGVSSGPAPSTPQLIVEERRNPEVLEALEKLTGQNFGYDKSRWMEWVRENARAKAAAKPKSR